MLKLTAINTGLCQTKKNLSLSPFIGSSYGQILYNIFVYNH